MADSALIEGDEGTRIEGDGDTRYAGGGGSIYEGAASTDGSESADTIRGLSVAAPFCASILSGCNVTFDFFGVGVGKEDVVDPFCNGKFLIN